jgi:hypothetical protein
MVAAERRCDGRKAVACGRVHDAPSDSDSVLLHCYIAVQRDPVLADMRSSQRMPRKSAWLPILERAGNPGMEERYASIAACRRT